MKKNNMHQLTVEEKRIEKDRREEKYMLIENFGEEKERLKKSASLPPKKTKMITIRLSEYTLQGIRDKAEKEGLPYQTLIGSILHKYVSG